jgi:hypothetical protein
LVGNRNANECGERCCEIDSANDFIGNADGHLTGPAADEGRARASFKDGVFPSSERAARFNPCLTPNCPRSTFFALSWSKNPCR